MLYSIKNIEDLEKLNQLVSLENQVKAVIFQDKLGKKNFHEDMKKVFEPVSKSNKDVSEEVMETMTETSIKNNMAIENINEETLELMKDKRLIAPYLASFLDSLFKQENKSQFRLIKHPNSTKVKGFLMNGDTPVTLFSNMLILERVINLSNQMEIF